MSSIMRRNNSHNIFCYFCNKDFLQTEVKQFKFHLELTHGLDKQEIIEFLQEIEEERAKSSSCKVQKVKEEAQYFEKPKGENCHQKNIQEDSKCVPKNQEQEYDELWSQDHLELPYQNGQHEMVQSFELKSNSVQINSKFMEQSARDELIEISAEPENVGSFTQGLPLQYAQAEKVRESFDLENFSKSFGLRPPQDIHQGPRKENAQQDKSSECKIKEPEIQEKQQKEEIKFELSKNEIQIESDPPQIQQSAVERQQFKVSPCSLQKQYRIVPFSPILLLQFTKQSPRPSSSKSQTVSAISESQYFYQKKSPQIVKQTDKYTLLLLDEQTYMVNTLKSLVSQEEADRKVHKIKEEVFDSLVKYKILTSFDRIMGLIDDSAEDPELKLKKYHTQWCSQQENGQF